CPPTKQNTPRKRRTRFRETSSLNLVRLRVESYQKSQIIDNPEPVISGSRVQSKAHPQSAAHDFEKHPGLASGFLGFLGSLNPTSITLNPNIRCPPTKRSTLRKRSTRYRETSSPLTPNLKPAGFRLQSEAHSESANSKLHTFVFIPKCLFLTPNPNIRCPPTKRSTLRKPSTRFRETSRTRRAAPPRKGGSSSPPYP
ncbi:hypothetical protein T484DRAFT_1757479, partial [Baffinella frigidus]